MPSHSLEFLGDREAGRQAGSGRSIRWVARAAAGRGLYPSRCLRPLRRAQGLHGARFEAASRRVHPGAVCRRARFSLHAAACCADHDHQAIEPLCRTITRLALAPVRARINSTGQVVLELKTAWHDGTDFSGDRALVIWRDLRRSPRPQDARYPGFHGYCSRCGCCPIAGATAFASATLRAASPGVERFEIRGRLID